MSYLKFILNKFIRNPLFLMGIVTILFGLVVIRDDFTPPSSKPDLQWVTLNDVYISDAYRDDGCIRGTEENGDSDCLSRAVIPSYERSSNSILKTKVFSLVDEGKQLTLGWYYTCEPWRRFIHDDNCKRIMEVHHKGAVVVSYEDSVRYMKKRNTIESKFMFNLFFVVGSILICLLIISYYVYPPKR